MVFFFKQKTAYELRISDWSSDVCSSDLLGRLALNPALREIRRNDGAEEIIEPRVMQVLLALAEARSEIVRREDLTERCWEGRIVGEDAINRVLSRLRRVEIGRASCRARVCQCV